MVNGTLQVIAYTTQDVNRSIRLNSEPVTPKQEEALLKLVERSEERAAGKHAQRASQ
jgi:hypothetical protein